MANAKQLRRIYAKAWMVEGPRARSPLPMVRVWMSPHGCGTPLLWFDDGSLLCLYYGAHSPRATVPDAVSPAWLVRLFDDPSVARELPGAFALVAVDRRKRSVLAVCDRLGVQTIYFSEDSPGTYRISTHLMWHLLATGHDGTVNRPEFFAHMGFGYANSPLSVYRGIRQVPPSGYLRCDDSGLRQKTYWTPPVPVPSGTLSSSEIGDTISDLRDSLTSRVADAPLFLGLTGGKDSLCLASLVTGALPVQTGTFGASDCADQLQAAEISKCLRLPHTTAGVCPPDLFGRWASTVAFHSGGLATASYVDMAAFVDTAIPRGAAYVMGEGGECVRDFFGAGGRPPVETLRQQFMTPPDFLQTTLAPGFAPSLARYPDNLLEDARRVAAHSTDELFALDFYRYRRMPGNFSLRHTILSALRPRITPFLDPRFIDRTYRLQRAWYRDSALHRVLIERARPELLPFFDKQSSGPRTTQDWPNRFTNGVGHVLYDLLDDALPLCEDVFRRDGVKRLCLATIERPTRAVYHLFRVLSFAVARRYLRRDARAHLSRISPVEIGAVPALTAVQ